MYVKVSRENWKVKVDNNTKIYIDNKILSIYIYIDYLT